MTNNGRPAPPASASSSSSGYVGGDSGAHHYARHLRAFAYEARKAAWISAHPRATPAEYTAAMRRIADECGV